MATVTGDGVADLAVSIPWFTEPDDPEWPRPDSNVPLLAGAVLMVSGADLLRAPDASQPIWDLGRLWWGTEAGEGAGTSVACDRDLSGDGVADVVVGSPWAQETTGRITLHLGGAALLDDGPVDQSAARTMDGPDEGGWFGIAITSIDIAGQALVAVGSAGAAGGAGRVHAYPAELELANPDRLIPRRRATFDAPGGRTHPDHYGRWLAAGDFDGDGEEDLLVGSPDYRLGNDGFDAGRAWVFAGGEAADWDLTTPAENASWQIEGTHAFQRVGRAPLVTDLDDDGVDDLVLPMRSSPDPS